MLAAPAFFWCFLWCFLLAEAVLGVLVVLLANACCAVNRLASATAIVRNLFLIRFSLLRANCLLGLMPDSKSRLGRADTSPLWESAVIHIPELSKEA